MYSSMAQEEIDHFLANALAIAARGIVLRVPVLICMIVRGTVGVSHYPEHDVEAVSILGLQRLEHICPLRVRHTVTSGGIQKNRRRVTCCAICYQPVWGSVIQLLVGIVIAISRKQEVDVIIKVHFE